MKRESFGTVNGAKVEMLTLTNKNGIEVRAITYGGIITSIKTPDRGGVPEGTAQYMLDRLAILLPVFDAALAEWGNVKELSI